MSAATPHAPTIAPPVVTLRHGTRIAHRIIAGADDLGVEIRDAAAGRAIGALNLPDAHAWLVAHGYQLWPFTGRCAWVRP